jgi:hypothetical protein
MVDNSRLQSELFVELSRCPFWFAQTLTVAIVRWVQLISMPSTSPRNSVPSPLHPAMLDDAALLADCGVRRQRRSGPGGQHRNKVETAVVITHSPTGIQGEASERRSQEQNRQVAVRRLRTNLAIHHRTPVSAEDYEPTALWQDRCRNRRISVNPRHEDFPAILAEALNLLAACDWEPREAAPRLTCSPSQLVKLIQLEPHAFIEVNRQRSARELRLLR